jgi:predicted flap endonuclease-1-like 5' DNA nuclease
MNEENGSLRCTLGCWGMGVFFGFIATMMLAVLGEFTWSAAVFMGSLLFVVVGLGLSALLCRPLPRMAHMDALHKDFSAHTAPARPAAAVRPVAPATAPATVHVAAPVAAPVMVPVAAERPVAADGKPEMLTVPRGGTADNLKEIKGVGPKLEALLHSMGVFHFDQIASWRAAEVAWVDENLEGFKGRVSRDHWVDQARILAAGGTTEFSRRVEKGDVY